MKTTRSTVLKVVVLIIVIAIPVILWWQRWNIHDTWRLRNYSPTEKIEQLASDTTMTDHARRLFYVYRPQLNDKQAFNQNCKSSERTIVLGCYVAAEGIYVYDVTDKRLEGVLQVTAAHEMLHAAYGRLGAGEKTRVNALLEETFKQLSDKRIRDTIEDYRKNGADILNELHSILATEVRELPPQLEDYYGRYFEDRLKVVEFSEQYERAFTERKNKVAEYDVQLDQLKKQVDEGEATLSVMNASLERERSRLEALLTAKEYETYNAGVNAYNAQVNAYNAQVRHIRSLIDQFNALVATRNAIVTEESELVKAIDSRPSTIDQQ